MFRRIRRRSSKTRPLTKPLSQSAVQSAVYYAVPELQGELTVTITNYDGAEYWACLKNGAAAPAVAGRQNWDNANYCLALHFTNSTGVATVSVPRARSVAVPANLRGVGSSVDAVAADAVAVPLGAAASRRRSAAGAAAAWVRGSATANAAAGNYFITVVAAAATNANVTLALTLSGSRCPQAGQAGANCAALPKVTVGQTFTATNLPVNGTALAQLANYEAINATTASFTVAGQVDSVDGKASIVARAGAFPTDTVFDFSLPIPTPKTLVSGSFLAPRAGRWYFAVVNQNASIVTANFTVTVTQCGAGHFGADCNANITKTGAPGAPDAVTVAANQQLYYSFSRYAAAAFAEAGPATLAIAAAQTVDEDSGANATAPAVYARLNALPTATTFDYVNCNVAACAEDQNTLIVAADAIIGNANDTWYVLVVPAVAGQTHVWNAAGGACANNCTNADQGSCNAATATCQCTESYTSFDCEVKVSLLERWEWALIIGGAVLVAIGLIGCIVYFIQRQSRRAGFERV